METMDELMLHFLQDIYDAEKRGLRGMQKVARAASEPRLKEAVLQHRDQSQQQISRLERVFELVTGKRPRGKPCAAMEGLSKEVDEAIEEGPKGPVLDAALIAGAQAVEHYEMARYGAMAAWARQAGKNEVAQLLQETLEEEKRSDQLLTELAESLSNPSAAKQGEQGEATQDQAPAPASRKTGSSGRKSAPAPKAAPARRGRTEAPAQPSTSRRSSRK